MKKIKSHRTVYRTVRFLFLYINNSSSVILLFIFLSPIVTIDFFYKNQQIYLKSNFISDYFVLNSTYRIITRTMLALC